MLGTAVPDILLGQKSYQYDQECRAAVGPSCRSAHRKELGQVQLGNALARRAILLFDLLRRNGIPTVLEHPRTSRLWLTREMQARQHSSKTCVIDLDQCQFGADWKNALACYSRMWTPRICANYPCDAMVNVVTAQPPAGITFSSAAQRRAASAGRGLRQRTPKS